MDIATLALIVVLATLVATLVATALYRYRNRLGVGEAVLIPSNTTSRGFKKHFPDLIGSEPRPLAGQSSANKSPDDRWRSNKQETFDLHKQTKLGNRDCQAAELSLLIRDRTKLPALLPVDVDIDKELLSIYKDPEMEDEARAILANKVRSRLQNRPDLYDRTTALELAEVESNGTKFAATRYNYYPRIQVEFSSKLQSPSPPDRFAYLGVVVVLPGNSPANFIDYEPKASDIVEFTRGTMTLNSQMMSKSASTTASGMEESTTKVSGTNEIFKTTRVDKPTSSGSLSPELSFTLSETLVRELKESIEARTSGVLEEGKIFFADFRSVKEKRIGGTYSFDLMLEVPSDLMADDEGDDYYCEPMASEVEADIYLVAVVRHLVKRGYVGWITQVHEPSNDDAYYEVLTKKINNANLWTFGGLSWGDKLMKEPPASITVEVVTGLDDASFVLKKDDDGTIIGQGSGRLAEINYSATATTEAQVEFMNVFAFDNGSYYEFAAEPSDTFEIEAGKNSKITVVGKYKQKAIRVPGQKRGKKHE